MSEQNAIFRKEFTQQMHRKLQLIDKRMIAAKKLHMVITGLIKEQQLEVDFLPKGTTPDALLTIIADLQKDYEIHLTRYTCPHNDKDLEVNYLGHNSRDDFEELVCNVCKASLASWSR